MKRNIIILILTIITLQLFNSCEKEYITIGDTTTTKHKVEKGTEKEYGDIKE